MCISLAFQDANCVVAAGNSVNMEGAVPTEQEINQPKPSKRARTSFTADQLQVHLYPIITIIIIPI